MVRIHFHRNADSLVVSSRRRVIGFIDLHYLMSTKPIYHGSSTSDCRKGYVFIKYLVLTSVSGKKFEFTIDEDLYSSEVQISRSILKKAALELANRSSCDRKTRKERQFIENYLEQLSK